MATRHPITVWVDATVRQLIPDSPVAIVETVSPEALYIDIASTPRAVRHVIGRQGSAIRSIRSLASRMAYASGPAGVVITVLDTLGDSPA
jgi:predicted RNA-binding protein YlqC (UPF0109 family)